MAAAAPPPPRQGIGLAGSKGRAQTVGPGSRAFGFHSQGSEFQRKVRHFEPEFVPLSAQTVWVSGSSKRPKQHRVGSSITRERNCVDWHCARPCARAPPPPPACAPPRSSLTYTSVVAVSGRDPIACAHAPTVAADPVAAGTTRATGARAPRAPMRTTAHLPAAVAAYTPDTAAAARGRMRARTCRVRACAVPPRDDRGAARHPRNGARGPRSALSQRPMGAHARAPCAHARVP